MTKTSQAATLLFDAAVGAFRHGSFQESVELYRQGLGHYPTCVAALLDLGKACEHLGDWRGSLEALDMALAQSPAHPVGLRRRARVREEQTVFACLADALAASSSSGASDGVEMIADEDVPSATVRLVRQALGWARGELGKTLSATAPRRVSVPCSRA